MRGLTPSGLLEAWELGQPYGPTVRALVLLAAAGPEAAWEELCAMPLGERDRRLLELRERTLGRRVDGVARCPACGERLDISLDTRELRAGGAGEAHAAGEGGPAGEAGGGDAAGESAAGGGDAAGEAELRVRPANSFDLLAAERCAEVSAARRVLVERCVVEARRGGAALAAAELSAEEQAEAAAALAAADPGAELLLALRCPACAHGWSELLDVASFVWSEIEVEARRLLREVHVLARAYGWREADVLALNSRRRRLYLEMAGS